MFLFLVGREWRGAFFFLLWLCTQSVTQEDPINCETTGPGILVSRAKKRMAFVGIVGEISGNLIFMVPEWGWVGDGRVPFMEGSATRLSVVGLGWLDSAMYRM
jgi:hypothetical protein